MVAKSKEETLVILDAHAILHRAYHALPDFSSPTGEPTGALYGVTTMLLKIIEDFQPDYMVACYDLPEPTYRHTAFDGYKAGRKKTDDALVAQIDRSRDIFKVFGVPIYEKPGFEADDILGSIAHYMKEHSHVRVIIASGDMDTLQCVDKKRVQVYTLKKGIKDTILYDEATVKDRFGFSPSSVPDYKGLRGDTSDNIPGIAGIGEKTGTILISKFGTIEKMYKALAKDEAQFKELGITPRIIGLLKDGKEEAEFSKMLATIRTDALDSFDIATAQWREQADTNEILNLFSEFGFRTVTDRVRKLFELGVAVTSHDEVEVTPQQLKEAAILLWLLESERTNASYDDIVDYGRSFLKVQGFEETVKALRARIAEEGLEHIFTEIELPLIPVIESMQETGITLDVKYLATLSKEFHKELTSLETSIYKHAGVEFNINSPKQLGDILFDTLGLKVKNAKKTAGGQRSTKESELEKLLGEHPIIEDILRYRELQKLVSTYIDTLPTLVKEDGKIHTTFLQSGTVTGRMGSKDPNIQNIPVKSTEGMAIRAAFIASPGYELVAIDYSQIELRIASILSEDKNMIEIFKKGEDVHHGVAMRVFGVGSDEVTPNMRRQAKVINFGILYGMGVNALRTNLGEDTKREDAQAFLNAYFQTFTRLAEYLEDTKTEARKLGYTKTLFGRRRHFAGIASSVPFIRAAAERMAINAPIQGTAADIVRIAMVRIAEYVKEKKLEASVRMLLQIHDELVFEIKTGEVEKHVPALLSIMEGVLVGKETFGVPIVAEVKVGHNWRDMDSLRSSSMLYVFYGTDRGGVRNAAHHITEPFGSPALIEEGTYTKGVVADAIGASSLFGGSECFLIDTPSSDDEFADEILSLLESMATSNNIFVVMEGALLADAKKKYTKHAITTEEFAADKPERFNVFQIAETLARKDKKQMWVLLQEARALGIRDEETIGILWWQLKALRLAKLTRSADEAGMKEYPYKKAAQSLRNFKDGEVEALSRSLLELYHEGHQGKRDIAVAFEQWVLSL